MHTSIQILPGIKKIGWVDSRHLPARVDLSAICGMTVAVMTDVYPIDFFDDPECECVTKKDSAGYEDAVSLKFCTDSPLPISDFMAFVITDVNGRSFLIGSKERPAIATPTQYIGTPAKRAAIEYNISHVSIKSMVSCFV